MEKKITTDTKITFKETGDKFRLTQTGTGFDLTIIRLTKKNEPESYSFQEFLDLYERGEIIIDGFEEADAPLVKSIITNYIHSGEIESLKANVFTLTGEKEALSAQITELTTQNSDLTTKNEQLIASNTELTSAKEDLELKNTKLNNALAAIPDEEK